MEPRWYFPRFLIHESVDLTLHRRVGIFVCRYHHRSLPSGDLDTNDTTLILRDQPTTFTPDDATRPNL